MMNKEKLNDIKLYGLYKDLYNSIYRNLSEILSDLNDNVYFSDIDKFDSFQKINDIYYKLNTDYTLEDNENKMLKSVIYASIRFLDNSFEEKKHNKSDINIETFKKSFGTVWPFYKEYMNETYKLKDMTNLKPFPFKGCVNDGGKVYDNIKDLNITKENKRLIQDIILSVQEYAENKQAERTNIANEHNQIELDFNDEENELELS